MLACILSATEFLFLEKHLEKTRASSKQKDKTRKDKVLADFH